MLKLQLVFVVIFSLLLAGCGLSQSQQIRVAQDNQDSCKSVIQEDEDLRWAQKFLGNNSPTPSMMVDKRYPSPKDMRIMARWMDIDVTCTAEYVEETSQISGLTSDPYWPTVLAMKSAKEDLYVAMLSGNMSYGTYFLERRDLNSEIQRIQSEYAQSNAEAQRRQQAAQAQAWSNAFSNAQKSFQNQPSIGSAFDKDKSQIDCTSWKVGNSVQTTCR